MPKRVEVSGRPRVNDIMGLNVLTMVEALNPTSGHASKVSFPRIGVRNTCPCANRNDKEIQYTAVQQPQGNPIPINKTGNDITLAHAASQTPNYQQ